MKSHELWQAFAQILLGNPAEKPYPGPEEAPSPGEQVIGTLTNPTALALWSFRSRVIAYIDDYKAASGLDDADAVKKLPEDVRDEHFQHIKEVVAVSHAASRAFWFYVGQEFPTTNHKSVTAGIRKDMQVVIWKSEPSGTGLESLLSGIAGIVIEVRRGFDGPSEN